MLPAILKLASRPFVTLFASLFLFHLLGSINSFSITCIVRNQLDRKIVGAPHSRRLYKQNDLNDEFDGRRGGQGTENENVVEEAMATLPPWQRLLTKWAALKDGTGNDQHLSNDNVDEGSERRSPSFSRTTLSENVSVEGLLLGGNTVDGIGPNITLGTILESQNKQQGTPAALAMDDAVESISAAFIAGRSSIDGLFMDALQKLNDLNGLVQTAATQEQQKEKDDLVTRTQNENFDIVGQVEESDRSSLSSLAPMSDNQVRDGVSSLLEGFLSDTTSALGPTTMQALVSNVTQLLFASAAEESSEVAQSDKLDLSLVSDFALGSGVDVNLAAGQASELTRDTFELLQFSSNVLNEGYFPKRSIHKEDGSNAISSNALFNGFDVDMVTKSDPVMLQAAEMAALSAAIYQTRMIKILHQYGHSLVHNMTTANIAWLVTDSVMKPTNTNGMDDPCILRTIVLRGYDASDESVDREGLVAEICNATRTTFMNGIEVHQGLLAIAEELYDDIVPYIDMASPSHKIAFAGHSIGGSLSNILIMLLCKRRGVGFVKERITNVFTFGAPPIAAHSDPNRIVSDRTLDDKAYCGILDAFGLEGDFVQSFIQPWDPISRLFSELDALYPLVEDLGDDGLTPWVNGPPRTLRPIFRRILEAATVWPRMRDSYELTASCKFLHIGVPHLLLPEPSRYLTDRLVSVNVAVPPTETIARCKSVEFYPILKELFPIDEFSISYVSVAIRSFIHHFHPAYGFALEEFTLEQRDVNRKATGRRI